MIITFSVAMSTQARISMVKMTSVISTQSLVHIFIIKGKGNKIFAITIISVFFFNEFNAKFMQQKISEPNGSTP